jgi:Uma2 family endonuclease
MDGGAPNVKPHRFTVADYHRMAEVGILGEDSQVELIRGQIIDMAPIGAPHLGMVNRLNRLLITMLAGRAVVSVQNPVRLDDGSEPEPDLAVLKPRADDYETATPRPADVLLLVEVADSTLRADRDIKVPLYAESGIPECWLVDVAGRAVEVYRQPSGGCYAQVRHVGPEGTLDIAALPGATLATSELFRPAQG